jgi:hypothetical protein
MAILSPSTSLPPGPVERPILARNTLFVGERVSGVSWAMKAYLRRQAAAGATVWVHSETPPRWAEEHYVNWLATGSAEGQTQLETGSTSVTARMRCADGDRRVSGGYAPLVIALDESLVDATGAEPPWGRYSLRHLERIVSVGRPVNVFVAASIHRPKLLSTVPPRIRDFFTQVVECREGTLKVIDV